MSRHRLLAGLALALGLAVLATAPEPARAQQLVADLSSHLVAVTTGFTGANVLLFGAVEGEGDVVVVVRGPDEEVVVRHKDRIAGIYINRERMTFPRVPSYYLVASNRPLDQIASPGEFARQEIGLPALHLNPQGAHPPALDAKFRAALIRNKMDEGLYSSGVAKVEFLGARLFRVSVYFPSNVPIGTYQVQVYLFKNGVISSAQTTPLVVSKIGLSADIYEYAHRDALAYGLIAVLLALAAGWAAGTFLRGA
ncbi:MAG TPA: TIGR02186 family protein [Alphaproteobacteria bacterium]|nr:TIGR02186 family protein [Alphaproteobacteria bacterium]